MSRRSTAVVRAAALALLLLSAIRASSAAEPTREPGATDLLPKSVVAVIEIPQPARLADALEQHALWHAVQSGYREIFSGPEYLFFQTIRTHIEQQIGMTWREAIDAVAGNGITLAFEPQSGGVVILVRAGDAERQQSTVQTLLRLARKDAAHRDRPLLKEDSYRGLPVYGSEQGRWTVTHGWLIATNRDELGQAVVDALLDGPTSSLTDNRRYTAAQQEWHPEAEMHAWLDLDAARAAVKEGPLKTNQTENPLAELLVGGLVTSLRRTPHVTAELFVPQDSFRLELSVPHRDEWIEDFRRYWFGPPGQGTADRPLETDDTLLSLSLYRQASEMWLRAGDLFDARMNDELAQADATLTTFFSGKDFGEDILGSFGPSIQLVVNRQEFERGQPVPAIKLPSFALIGRMKNPQTSTVELRRTFQSLIGFLNVIGAMEGNPQLDQDVEFYNDQKLYTSHFITEPEEQNSTAARIHFNFSPSLAFQKDWFIIASTRGLARQLSDVAAARRSEESTQANSQLKLNVPVLRSVLLENREQLVAQNMLEDGLDRKEAELEMDEVFRAMELFRDASLRLMVEPKHLRLNLSVRAAGTQ